MRFLRANLGLFTFLLLLLAGGVFLLVRTAQRNYEPPLQTASGTVAYRTVQGGAYEINVWDISDRKPTTLVRFDGDLANPTWTQTGAFLAYETYLDDQYDIYVASAETGDQRRLTTDPAWDMQPTFSPSNDRVAFVSDREGGQSIYVLPTSGGAETERLTDDTSEDTYPAWSPDGSRIAFVSNREGTQDLFAVDVESGEITALTSGAGDDLYPTWSPDGSRIAFASTRNGAQNIYELTVGTGEIVALTSGDDLKAYPSYGPGGQRLLYTVQSDSNADLFLLRMETGEILQLTNTGIVESQGVFRPTGS